MYVQISFKLESDRLIANHQDLRRQRRDFWRSSLTDVLVNSDQSETLRLSKVKNGPTTRSKAKGRGTASKSNAQSKVDPKGPPTAHDGQGNALWTRPSDGKLVYLNCPIGGCHRNTFINVLAFRNHMSAVEGMHKLKRFPKSNNHALETYGIVAPGQEDPLDDANVPPVSVAPTANMRSAGVLTPKTPGSNDQTVCSLPVGLHTPVGLTGRSSTSSDAHRLKQLGRSYPETSLQTTSRAQRAAQVFDGYLSDESDDIEEDESPTNGIPRDPIDQHRAATPKTPSPTPSLGKLKVIDIRTAASHRGMDMVASQHSVERAIKEDGDRSPVFVKWQLLDSPRPERAVAVVVASSEETVDEPMRFATNTLETQKRAASDFPTTPPPSSKRFRSEDKSRTI